MALQENGERENGEKMKRVSPSMDTEERLCEHTAGGCL